MIEKHELGKDYGFGPQFWGGFGPQARYDWEYNHKRIDTTIGPGGTGWYMTNKLLGILLPNGGEILYRTAAEHLELDADGRVCGVTASDPGGKLHIVCSTCVIAAGVFSRNKALTARFPIFVSDALFHVYFLIYLNGKNVCLSPDSSTEISKKNHCLGGSEALRSAFL